MKSGFPLILTTLLGALAFSSVTVAKEDRYPFFPGEKLTFQVRWAFIPAGEAVLQVFPIEIINGHKVYHFGLSARTYPVIDLFYKLRGRIEAYADENLTHSILYKETKEGHRPKKVIVRFNWEKGEVQWSNFGEKRPPIPVKPGTFDPLSVYYALRLHNLEENMVIEKPLTDGKKWILGRARVIKRERVTVLSGTYDTYLVEPNLEHIGGVFKKSKDAKLQIWVTADARRIPVKIKSKIAIGSFVGELMSVEKEIASTSN
jgi:hypothetical protein